MTEEIWLALIGIVSASVSSFVTWIINKKKAIADTETTLLENMQESLEFYKQLSDDNRERLNEVLKRNDELEAEIRELRKQVTDLMFQMCMNTTCAKRVLKNISNETKINKKVQEA